MSEFIVVLSGHKQPLQELTEVYLAYLDKKCEWDGDDLVVVLTPDEIVESYVGLDYMKAFFEEVQESYAADDMHFTFTIEEVPHE